MTDETNSNTRTYHSPSTARILRSTLNELGAMSPSEIADHFLEWGITGKRGIGAKCPVANYIRQRDERLRYAFVGTESARPYMHAETDECECFPLPATVQQFIADFDGGHYPELDSERSPE